ncbi:thiamine pyrophosphate-binding protein [Skermania sp. ID1734]|uniref:thiamine pyrophosphate-binding protein n=1 Tax=Skermania sp. ID1734 TaxID=2597516 RepID=UPI002105660C|nr:thiamine pyrophosphate-binding protein [Skermania sp. ID1734]
MSQRAVVTRVADYLVDAVVALGVRHVFGVGGANIEDIYDAIHNAGDRITGVVAKHEFSAATMAEGYARSTNGIGVVAVTSGGGAMNVVAGLAESFTSKIPILALVGQAPTELEGRGAFQDSSGKAGSLDALALFRTVSRFAAKVTSAEMVSEVLADAVTAAMSGGPAVLLLPKDIQQLPYAGRPFDPPQISQGYDEAALGMIAEELSRAGSVVIIAGEEVSRADARAELALLAEALGATVAVTAGGKDAYPTDGPGYCGVVGTMGNPKLAQAISASEMCLVVGSRMPMTDRAGIAAALSHSRLGWICSERPFVESAQSTYCGADDIRTALGKLANAVDARPKVAAQRAPAPPQVPAVRGLGLRYQEAVAELAAALPPEADVFADAGNTGSAVVHHLPLTSTQRFVLALGMGGMGYSFGAGIGAAFASGGSRRTFVIAGDGAFFMHGMEIHTAVEHRLPLTFVVFNNNSHAMCLTREQLFYGDRYSFNRFRSTDLGTGLGVMFPGLPSWNARTIDELRTALAHAEDTDGPAFISVTCDPDEIPPFAPFLNKES